MKLEGAGWVCKICCPVWTAEEQRTLVDEQTPCRVRGGQAGDFGKIGGTHTVECGSWCWGPSGVTVTSRKENFRVASGHL